MNAFYERLYVFGASVQAAAENSELPLAHLFTLVHPGFPVISRTKSVIPQLNFKEECPVPERRRIRQLLRKAFSRNTPRYVSDTITARYTGNYPA